MNLKTGRVKNSLTQEETHMYLNTHYPGSGIYLSPGKSDSCYCKSKAVAVCAGEAQGGLEYKDQNHSLLPMPPLFPILLVDRNTDLSAYLHVHD